MRIPFSKLLPLGNLYLVVFSTLMKSLPFLKSLPLGNLPYSINSFNEITTFSKCSIPAGQLLGYALAPLLMTVPHAPYRPLSFDR